VLRISIEPIACRDLDDLAEIHHGNPVAKIADYREVVCHEQKRRSGLRLELL
jgi:hypothetical protein